MRKSVGTAARRLHRLQVVRHLSHVLRAPVRLFGTNLPWVAHSSQNLYRSGWRNVFFRWAMQFAQRYTGPLAESRVDLST